MSHDPMICGHIGKNMGLERNVNSGMRGLANKSNNGDCGLLASGIDAFFSCLSVNIYPV